VRSRVALIAFGCLTAFAAIAPRLAPYDPGHVFAGYPFAPPMRPHVVDDRGAWHAPFAYPIALADPIERRYVEDRSRRISWESSEPWFLLGSDDLARDVFSRVLAGARLSLGVSLLAAVFAIVIGAAVGATAGYAGGWTETWLMRMADLVLVLPIIYVVLALRGVLPLKLSSPQIFTALVGVFALVGWPTVARGVRGIVVSERQAEYVEAARALGASGWRIVARHLLPATRGFLGVQATLLVPAFIMSEATLSFVGLGFMPPTPSWGAMLQAAASVRTAADTPWLLAPAAAIVGTVFVIHSVAGLPGYAPERVSQHKT
jgi:peptide/nickel transport system permease protein